MESRMMKDEHGRKLELLYRDLFGEMPLTIDPLPGSGSGRRYFRLESGKNGVVGAFNEDLRENQAFFSFTRTFRSEGLPVPALLSVSEDQRCYLLQDLGDTTLFSRICETTGSLSSPRDQASGFARTLMDLYKAAIDWLPLFQKSAPDFQACYPRQAFDRQSMMWDLSYFKYYYLKLAGISFDEQKLEDDFNRLCSFLLDAPATFFMYRDFQSRNIMITSAGPWFIDYQGGRKGALQYDVASLLYDAKADLPQTVRDELLEYYLKVAEPVLPDGAEGFLKYFQGFSLIRILQAMGAYGFRGFYQQKKHFLQSIPYALRNLKTLIPGVLSGNFPELGSVLERMVSTPLPAGILHPASDRAETKTVFPDPANESVPFHNGKSGSVRSTLLVTILSFSYRNGIPGDPSGHGGGFVFDCRALPNPGKFEKYRKLTGKDPDVIRFLQQEPEVHRFLSGVFQVVGQSVEKYLQRDFTNLMVAFGCTGGQHRSVYCAEQLADHLSARFNISVQTVHREWPDGVMNQNTI
ncbi:MAG: RNase adapter RapZ [Bacteroidales bacterium]|nr:RNase adapter RapZ [Bacteroidales bacterium]